MGLFELCWQEDGAEKIQHAYERQGPAGAHASAQILPVLIELLELAQWTLSDLDACVFGCGPGSFTGLRTATSVIQGLAFGCQKPVMAIGTLLAIAEAARKRSPQGEACHGRVFGVIQDARMGEVYWARYQRLGHRWREQVSPQLCAPAQIPDLSMADHWVGNGLGLINPSALPLATMQDPQAQPTAAALALLAAQRWRDGDRGDLAMHALPLYIRDKVAQTTAERQRA